MGYYWLAKVNSKIPIMQIKVTFLVLLRKIKEVSRLKTCILSISNVHRFLDQSESVFGKFDSKMKIFVLETIAFQRDAFAQQTEKAKN